MACDVNASGFAQVFKYQVGLDTSFSSIYIDTTPNVFDFVTSNNTIYFSNGSSAWKWDPVNGLSLWGIAIGTINSTATATAGTGSQSGSGLPWTNPTNVTSAVSFATITLPGTSLSVSSITVNTEGSGYVFNSSFPVSFSGGGGSGATATAYTRKDHVLNATVTAGGTSYTSAPAVSFGSGGGTGATGTANMTGSGTVYAVSQSLIGTNFSLGVSAGSTVKGIQVNFTAIATPSGTGSATVTCPVQLVLNGAPIGTPKNVTLILDGSSHVYSLGGASDLWNTTLSGASVGTSTFGFQITLQLMGITGTYSLAFQVNNYQITTSFLGGPAILINSGGSFAATNGFQYVECFGNSNTGHVSSPTPPSTTTGSFSTKLNVEVTLIPSTDPQVNQLRLFRTTDSASGLGGQSYFEIPTSPYPNIGWTLTAAANASAGSTVYTGTPIGASGFASAVGQSFIVAGFSTGANNGTFPCTAATATTVTLTNSGGVAESHAATAYIVALDAAADTTLNIYSIAPTPTFNDPPTPGQNPVYFAGRIWMFNGNKEYFSGLEEISIGVPEECFPSGVAGNFYSYDEPVQSIGVAGSGSSQSLLTKCGGRLYGITGTTLDTFQRTTISRRRGSRSIASDTMIGGMNAWLDSANQIWATDGSSLEELSIPIRPDLAGVIQSKCSMTFHTSGVAHWLVFSTGSKLYLYDIDTEQWMPPWNFAADYIYSGEISPGNYVLMASTGTKAVQLNLSKFNDQGATYRPEIVTNLMSVVPDFGKRFSYIGQGMYDEPSRTGVPYYIEVDTNNTSALSDVLTTQDDDPTTATYSSIFSSKVGADTAYNRSASGTAIIQNIFPQNAPSCRWYGLKIVLQKADSLDKLYGWFMAYKAVGGR